MNLVRHELGFSKTESRFPTKGTCLAIYSRCVNAEMPIEEVLRPVLSLVRGLGRRAASSCSPPMSRPSSARTCSITTTSCSTGRRWWPSPTLAAEIGGALRPRAGRRIPGHQPAAVLDPAGAEAGRARPDRGRRRRAVDLFVPRRHRAQHPGFPEPVQPAGRDRHARPQLPLDAADPGRRQWRDRARRRALHQEPLDRPRPRPSGRNSSAVRDEADQARYIVEQVLENREDGMRAQAAGGAVPDLAPQRAARDRADPAQHSLRQVRRPEVSRCRARQGHAGAAAVRREPARPRRRLPPDAAAAGRRPGLGAARARSHGTTPPIRSAL